MKGSRNSGPLRIVLLNLIGAAFITVFVFLFVFSPYEVEGNSMSPVINNGDKIIVSSQVLTGKIRRFDIVVFRVPGNGSRKLIKRVIGLPGESVGIRSGKVFIDHKELYEPYLMNKGDVNFRAVNMPEKKIPEGNYFLLGDLREKSVDSRDFGTLDKGMIAGKILFRYWPLNRFGIVK